MTNGNTYKINVKGLSIEEIVINSKYDNKLKPVNDSEVHLFAGICYFVKTNFCEKFTVEVKLERRYVYVPLVSFAPLLYLDRHNISK